QAEDGIRDATVTGVQTCALPILILGRVAAIRPLRRWVGPATTTALATALGLLLVLGILPHLGIYRPVTVLSASMRPAFAPGDMRSEERRVGEEWSGECVPGQCMT